MATTTASNQNNMTIYKSFIAEKIKSHYEKWVIFQKNLYDRSSTAKFCDKIIKKNRPRRFTSSLKKRRSEKKTNEKNNKNIVH